MTDPTDRDASDTEAAPDPQATSAEPSSTRSRSRSRSTGSGATRTRTRRRVDDGADGTSGPDATDTKAPDDRATSRRAGGRGRADIDESKADTSARVDASAEPRDDGSRDDDARDDDARDDDGGGEGGRKRRRRGRRGRGGRGRGRGGRGGGGDEDEARSSQQTSGEARTKDTAADKPEKGAGGDRRAKGDRAGKGAKGSPAAKGTERDDDADEPQSEEERVEAAMAKGGTRMAAKRSRRGSDNGGGRNGNGRGRGQRPGGVPEEVRRAILEGPPRTMLVTAREDRTQIAVLEDRTVVEHYVTRKQDVTYVGNIYMARVQNVLPGMEAAFLDIGKGRNGVLYAGEVLYDELDLEEGEDERIENVLKPGQKVLVQVTKDPMGSKGPRLTMHLSLAGRYMVLAPNSDLFGISRKLTDRERDRLRKVVKKVKPSEHGVIVRTAAEGATDEQLTADLERLLAKWQRVEEAVEDAKALSAVYEEPPLVVKVIRDNFGPEFERCIVDDEDLYHQVRDYLDEVAPELLDKVELYGAPTTDARSKAAGAPSADGTTPADDADAESAPGADEAAADKEPAEDVKHELAAGTVDLAAARERREELPALFEAYDVADQLRKAMGKKVWLPSGGYLIIETTEAMKVIDVNTGKFTGGNDTNLEEVVLKTNLEAADEIVRQLRLRDMGGIIVIDFIDMLLKSNQDQVVRRLKRELLRDRTKTRVSEVSKLGLVQMTRKNVSQGLVESFSHTCQDCEGRGLISELI